VNKAPRPDFLPLGEQAVVVSFGDAFEPETHRQVVGLSRELDAAPFPGYVEHVPSYTTVCVYYDALAAIDAGFAPASAAGASVYDAVCVWLQERIDAMVRADTARDAAGKTVRIPVCYCGECGPDLPALAAGRGLTPEAAAAAHAGAHHTVSMIGFMPGFPYMSGLPEALAAPRLDTPRARVPLGSVAVAGRQTGIYPAASPGGWRLIGRTAALLFDAGRTPPSLFEIGDTVVFEPVSHAEMARGLRG